MKYVEVLLLTCCATVASLSFDVGRASEPSSAVKELGKIGARQSEPTNEDLEFFFRVYENEDSSAEEKTVAVDALRRASEAGLPAAQYNYGFLLATGEWVERDDHAALPLLERVAVLGDQHARFWAGVVRSRMYYAAPDFEEERIHLSKAEYWLRSVIQEEVAGSRKSLVAMEVLGRVLLSDAPEEPEGMRLLKVSAEGGYKPAIKVIKDFAEIMRDVVREGEGGQEGLEALTELDEYIEQQGW